MGTVYNLYQCAIEFLGFVIEPRVVKDTINVSINYLDPRPNGKYIFKFRTLEEMNPSHVFFDKTQLLRIQQLSDKTTKERPFLPFDVRPGSVYQRRDNEINKACGNLVNSFCLRGLIAQEIVEPVAEKVFVFGL